MVDAKQLVILNVAPTIDQINADRITQVLFLIMINNINEFQNND